ncbi:MAG: CoA transferase [Dehalococcoidia bacterium]|nr:CoA transferase [Dehalococcoidia bacterium]
MSPEPDQISGALDGVRVVNAGQIIAGPFTATLLAEFGADVIKVEAPANPAARTVQFAQDHRGQRGVTLNLRHPDGAALFRKLCATSDVLVENFRPGTLERLGMAPDDLRKENLGLIAVRISGYGQTGPYRDRTGFDRVALGFSGMTYVTGDADRPPVRPGYFVADYGTGAFAAYGVMLALRARELTGRGQDVDMGLFEAPWRMSGTHLPNYGLSSENRERAGNYYPGVVPAEQFETSDGHHLIINATTQRPFERLCEAIGQPELIEDPRFTPREELVANAHAIHDIIRPWVAERTLEENLTILDEHAVPCTKVFATSDIVADPQYAAREQILTVEAPDGTPLLQPGIVPRLTDTPGQVRRRAPNPGEHNDEVFGELLGVAAEELARLREEGAI